MLLIGIMVCNMVRAKQERNGIYSYIKMSNLDNIEDDDYYVVYTSSMCGTCMRLKNDLLKIEEKHKDINKRHIYAVDVDTEEKFNDEYMKRFDVKGIPFVVHYNKHRKKGILYDNIQKDEIINFFDLQ